MIGGATYPSRLDVEAVHDQARAAQREDPDLIPADSVVGHAGRAILLARRGRGRCTECLGLRVRRLFPLIAAWEQAESAVRYAAWAADHDPDALPLAAALAAVYTGPRYFEVATGMVQYHGGVGYTWEHDAHLYYKRATSDELLLGSPGAQRAHLADLLGV